MRFLHVSCRHPVFPGRKSIELLTISSNSTAEFDGEPFTAVAGETYEFDEDDPFVVGSYKCEPVE